MGPGCEFQYILAMLRGGGDFCVAEVERSSILM
jgi:hypothetical protein